MKRLLLLIALAGSMALLAGAGGTYKGGTYEGDVATFGKTWIKQGSAAVDTFDFLVRDSRYPNTASQAEGFTVSDSTHYDIFNSGTDGAAVRWGWVYQAQPTTVQASTSAWSDYTNWTRTYGTEDDNTWDGSQRFFFVWFNIDGLLTGQKVEEAYLVFNSSGATSPDASEKMWARADTVSADYRILDGTSAGYVGSNNDYARFCASWDELDESTSTAWSPLLDDRDDYHDFGPRSNTYINLGSAYAVGDVFRLDVTDAMQQVIDNGETERGVLFVIYGTTNTASGIAIAAGISSTLASRGGNPLLYGRVTSRRGAKPWSGVRVPASFTLDAAYAVQTGYYDAFKSAGYTFDAALDSISLTYDSGAREWPDSAYVIDPTSIDFQSQGTIHASIAKIGPDSLATEMSRQWWDDFFSGSFDTTRIVDWSWGSGPQGNPYKDREAVYAMVDWGYRSARDGGPNWLAGTEGFGGRTPLSWDNPTNLYLMRGESLEFVMTDIVPPGTGTAPADTATIYDRLLDYVDIYYTDYGKSALLFYGHNYNYNSSAEFLTAENFAYICELSDRLNCFEVVPHRSIVSQRLSSFMAPAAVETFTGWTQKDSTVAKTVAAQQDSLYSADGAGQLMKLWITPK